MKFEIVLVCPLQLVNLSGIHIMLNLYGEFGYYRLMGLPFKDYAWLRAREFLGSYVARKFWNPPAPVFILLTEDQSEDRDIILSSSVYEQAPTVHGSN